MVSTTEHRLQILTGLSNGQIVVLYSPHTSINGAKLVLNKGPPRKVTIEDMSDALAAPTIITPHALPMFRDGEIARGTKRKREKDRMDPRKSHRPELPVTGPGKGGRVGASATQHVVQNLVRDTTRDEDVSTILSGGCFDGRFEAPDVMGRRSWHDVRLLEAVGYRWAWHRWTEREAGDGAGGCEGSRAARRGAGRRERRRTLSGGRATAELGEMLPSRQADIRRAGMRSNSHAFPDLCGMRMLTIFFCLLRGARRGRRAGHTAQGGVAQTGDGGRAGPGVDSG